MTLTELVPTLRRSHPIALPSGLWPASATPTDDGDVQLGGVPATEVAARFGTPAQVLDLSEVRRRVGLLRRALPEAEIAFAGKALLCKGLLKALAAEGLSLDVCSAGEIAVARAAGFPAERIILHGNAKTPEDLKAALTYGVGRIVLDSPEEAAQLAGLVTHAQQVLLRVTPGVDARTHKAITTGTEGQKFGVALADAEDAIGAILTQPRLHLVGLHCHIGSQVSGVDAYEESARRMVRLVARVRARYGLTLTQLDLGGGFAIPYTENDEEF
ncbi:diaminopimelate decarboxylase family protein, partial [Actinokineospora iranica]